MNEEVNIFNAIKSDQIKEITKDLTEAAIDQFLEEGLFKDIPIIGTIYNIYNLSQKISNSFFTKKIIKFLFEIKNIPKIERENFIEKMNSEKKTKNLGEKIIVILNRIDDDNKATILGKLFKITIEGEIEVSTFTRLSHIVDKVYLEDLIELKERSLNNLTLDEKYNLSQAGVLYQTIKDNREHEDYIFKNTGNREYIPPKFNYEISDYGKIIIKHG